MVLGNSLFVFSIIWSLHDKLPFALAIQSFLLISHFQIQRVLCPNKSSLLAFFIVLIGVFVQNLSGDFAKQLIQYFT
jgi:membrane-bound metal-dependent hydrolase YbcI (DUF457 family)